MRSIWKYEVKPGPFVVDMPEGAQILSVQLQGAEPQMWVLVDPEAPKVETRFVGAPTGGRLPDEVDDFGFVGTFQLLNGLVFHLFVEEFASEDDDEEQTVCKSCDSDDFGEDPSDQINPETGVCGMCERKEAVEAGTPAPATPKVLLSLGTMELVTLGTPAALAELQRRGRDATGKRIGQGAKLP